MLTVGIEGRVVPASRDRARAIFALALAILAGADHGYSIFTMMVVSLVGWWALSRVLERLRGIPDVHKAG